MELTAEQIAEIGLSEEQLPKLKTVIETHVADLKKEWDGKANENAEKIIDGAAKSIESLTGIPRMQGQKVADYLKETSTKYFDDTKISLQRKEQELDRKLKEGGGDSALKAELEQVKQNLDTLKQKEAQFADWEKNDYKGKYEETTQKMSQMELRVAFSNVKPSFPDTVNQYEAKAKWDEFQKNVITTHNIKLNEENEAIAVDKTNEYKIVKLADLVKTDKTISELAKGRAATGLGSGQKQNTTVEGVPFEVPENATSEERTKSIKEYLTGTLNLAVTSQEYAKKFAEYNSKLLEKTPKK
jgi:hypothetical protein